MPIRPPGGGALEGFDLWGPRIETSKSIRLRDDGGIQSLGSAH